jgi:hypothetical protein
MLGSDNFFSTGPWDFGMDLDADPYPRIRTFDQRIRLRILLFSSVTFKMPTKNDFFYAYSFLKVHLYHSSMIKSHKEVTKR